MSTARRFLTLLNIALMLGWSVWAIAVFDRLPDTIPMHFGPSGAADSFAARSVGSWFALPAIGIGTTVLMLVLARAAARKPDLYSVPAKDLLLSLPVAQQQPFFGQITTLLLLLSTSVLLVFIAIHYDSWRVAIGAQQGLSAVSWAALGLCLGGSLLVMPIWLMRFQRDVRSEAKKHGAAQTNAQGAMRRSS